MHRRIFGFAGLAVFLFFRSRMFPARGAAGHLAASAWSHDNFGRPDGAFCIAKNSSSQRLVGARGCLSCWVKSLSMSV